MDARRPWLWSVICENKKTKIKIKEKIEFKFNSFLCVFDDGQGHRFSIIKIIWLYL